MLPDFVTATGVSNTLRPRREKLDYIFTDATLILTNRCNLRCVYCFGGYVPCPTEVFVMPVEIIHATIDYLVESAKRSGEDQIGAWMFGGEPTQPWTSLVEATQYLRSEASRNALSSHVGITTNGCVVPQRARWLAENMDTVLLSMDGPEDIHNAQRSGSFNRVFSTAKEIYRIAPHKLKLRATVSAASVRRLSEIVEFFGENFPFCILSGMVKFVYDGDKEKEILEWTKKLYSPEQFARSKELITSEDPNKFFKVKDLVENTEKLWQDTEPKFLDSLAAFFEVERNALPEFEATAYLMRIPKYPLSHKKGNYWFAMPLNELPERKLQVIAHELTHLYMFEMYGGELAKKFDEKMIDNIKEVAAVIAVCTHFQSFLKGVKEGFHNRNKEFASFVSGRIKNPQDPKFKEILKLAESYTSS